MTFYDAVYVALAVELRTPLLTANVRDQGKFAGASVYDIAKWK
jgi:predicted nucleic acid-binding protein